MLVVARRPSFGRDGNNLCIGIDRDEALVRMRFEDGLEQAHNATIYVLLLFSGLVAWESFGQIVRIIPREER